MPKKHTFSAKILDSGGGGAIVEIPFDVEKAFGSKRPKVKTAFEGVPYRGLLARMGGENYTLIVSKRAAGRPQDLIDADLLSKGE